MEEPIIKCASCKEKLDYFDRYFLTGEDIFDPISGMRYNTGKTYCKNCYGELTSQNIKKEEPSFEFENVNINDLEPSQSNVNLFVEVIDKHEETVNKKGRSLRLGKFKIKNNDGDIVLTLWQNIIDKVEVGDRLIIKNAYVQTYKGEKQITLGKGGTLLNLEDL